VGVQPFSFIGYGFLMAYVYVPEVDRPVVFHWTDERFPYASIRFTTNDCTGTPYIDAGSAELRGYYPVPGVALSSGNRLYEATSADDTSINAGSFLSPDGSCNDIDVFTPTAFPAQQLAISVWPPPGPLQRVFQ